MRTPLLVAALALAACDSSGEPGTFSGRWGAQTEGHVVRLGLDERGGAVYVDYATVRDRRTGRHSALTPESPSAVEDDAVSFRLAGPDGTIVLDAVLVDDELRATAETSASFRELEGEIVFRPAELGPTYFQP